MEEELITVKTGAASSINIAISYPEKWNGRLIGIGNVGMGGTINENELRKYALKGFVAATTDLGTSPNPKERGIDNPDTWDDFGHRATHLMAEVAKERITSRYHTATKASYFVGQSTGGQQGLSSAQRYPCDFDALLLGVSAHERTALHSYFLWNYQHTHNHDGTTIITKEEEKAYHKAALDYFANIETFPYAKGHFISSVAPTDEDQEKILRLTKRNIPSISPTAINAIRALQKGPSNTLTQEKIFCGLPPGAPFAVSMQNLHIFNWVFDKKTNYNNINFSHDIDHFIKTLSPHLDATNPNITTFKNKGGKIILFGGTHDGITPCASMINYYEKVRAIHPDISAFFKLFILPGRAHIGGPGLQELHRPLETLIKWHEKSIPPQLEATSCTLRIKLPLAEWLSQ